MFYPCRSCKQYFCLAIFGQLVRIISINRGTFRKELTAQNIFKDISNTKYQPVSRSVIANEKRRMLCVFFNMTGFLTIIRQNREFSKQHNTAIVPNITCLTKAGIGIAISFREMFPSRENLSSLILENLYQELNQRSPKNRSLSITSVGVMLF